MSKTEYRDSLIGPQLLESLIMGKTRKEEMDGCGERAKGIDAEM